MYNQNDVLKTFIIVTYIYIISFLIKFNICL